MTRGGMGLQSGSKMHHLRMLHEPQHLPQGCISLGHMTGVENHNDDQFVKQRYTVVLFTLHLIYITLYS